MAGTLVGLLAVVTLMGRADGVHAQTFTPELTVTVVNPEPEVSSDYTVEFNVPEGDVNFAGLVAFIPGDYGIIPGDKIDIGAIVGELTAQATLGLINGACNTILTVDFTFLNSSIDIEDTVSFEDSDPDTDEGFQIDDFSEDKDGSGLPDGFEKYPDFINRVLEDENGNPQQPIRRSAGITVVAGIDVLLQFLIFEPGTFINENIPNDADLGYPTVTLLQNIGDPEIVLAPGPITDFCTRLTSTNTSFALTKDNGCTNDAVAIDDLDPICESTGAVVVEEGGTDPDETGQPLFVNPLDGEYTFTIIGAGQRDADGDTYENTLDTCPLVANTGDPRVGGDGDLDSDGLDAACDPNDNEVNSDQDVDGYLNRGDNCPQDPNGEAEDNQADEDSDGIGDACDPNADDADAQGELIVFDNPQQLAIGTGVGPGGPPSAEACPDCGLPGAGGTDTPDDGGGGDDDDSSSSTLIIIIVAIVAGVVIVGGGAFFLSRRGGGGGGVSA